MIPIAKPFLGREEAEAAINPFEDRVTGPGGSVAAFTSMAPALGNQAWLSYPHERRRTRHHCRRYGTLHT